MRQFPIRPAAFLSPLVDIIGSGNSSKPPYVIGTIHVIGPALPGSIRFVSIMQHDDVKQIEASNTCKVAGRARVGPVSAGEPVGDVVANTCGA